MPKTLIRNLVAVAALAWIASAAAHSDGPATPHGGEVQDAGRYHVELVTKGNSLTVYMMDGDNKPVSVKGATATATVLTKSGKATVPLAPADGGTLQGRGQFEPAPGMKVVVSVTLAGEAPVQARFSPAVKPGK